VPPVTSAHQPCGGKGNPTYANAKVRRQPNLRSPCVADTLNPPADGASMLMTFLGPVFLGSLTVPRLAVLLLPVCGCSAYRSEESPCPCLGEIDRSYREPAVDILRDSAAA